jgi:hypothetical protein
MDPNISSRLVLGQGSTLSDRPGDPGVEVG